MGLHHRRYGSIQSWRSKLPMKLGAPAPLPASCPWSFSPARVPALPETARGFRGSMREIPVRGNLPMNRRIEHGDLEDTEPESLPELRGRPTYLDSGSTRCRR